MAAFLKRIGKLCCVIILCGIIALAAYRFVSRNSTPVITLEALNTYTLLPYTPEACTQNPVALHTLVSQIQQCKAPEASCVALADTTKTLLVLKNIPEREKLGDRVILYSRGYAFRISKPFFNTVPRVGGGVVAAYTHIRDQVIHLPCITFDKYDGHSTFSFGQDLDIACINAVYDALISMNPDIKIILMADCLGGLAALRFMARYTEKTANIDTIILESPLVSAHDFFEQTPKSIQHKWHQTWLYQKTGFEIPTSWLRFMLEKTLSWWFSSYDPGRDTLDAHAIKNKRIFIGHLQDDFVISNSGISKLVAQLREHNSVTFIRLRAEHFEGAVPAHCKLAASRHYQREVNLFLSPPKI